MGEVALITGAASGIGAAVARRLSSRGAALVLIDRSSDNLELQREALEASGAEVRAVVADVTNDDELRTAADEATNLGGLHTVVACAGIESHGDVTTTSVAEWERTIAVNLTGIFLTARHTVPLLLKSGTGTFTAIASDAGVFGAKDYAAYCASKHGIIGLIKCMALDHGPAGLRSNVICPSFVTTPMAERIFSDTTDAERDYYASSVPLGRFADPTEVADAVAHLSSNEASYVNGHVYRLDAGSTAGYFHA